GNGRQRLVAHPARGQLRTVRGDEAVAGPGAGSAHGLGLQRGRAAPPEAPRPARSGRSGAPREGDARARRGRDAAEGRGGGVACVGLRRRAAGRRREAAPRVAQPFSFEMSSEFCGALTSTGAFHSSKCTEPVEVPVTWAIWTGYGSPVVAT